MRGVGPLRLIVDREFVCVGWLTSKRWVRLWSYRWVPFIEAPEPPPGVTVEMSLPLDQVDRIDWEEAQNG